MKLTNIALFALIAFIAVDQWQDFQEAREQEEYRAFLLKLQEKVASQPKPKRPVHIYWDEKDDDETHSESALNTAPAFTQNLQRQQDLDDIEDRLLMIELFND